jgi:hypothetical protein
MRDFARGPVLEKGLEKDLRKDLRTREKDRRERRGNTHILSNLAQLKILHTRSCRSSVRGLVGARSRADAPSMTLFRAQSRVPFLALTGTDLHWLHCHERNSRTSDRPVMRRLRGRSRSCLLPLQRADFVTLGDSHLEGARRNRLIDLNVAIEMVSS